MARRKGRDLEVLVRDLERFLSDTPVEIRSPEHFTGRLSGIRREVDVTVRGKVGSLPVLAMIECRKRGTPSDVTWIEQIATKRDDIGAHRAVAVAMRRF